MTLVDLDKVAPVLQVISQGCILTYGIWWISLHYVKIRQRNYYCAVYTMTLQNHTSSMPNHINSIPWMHAVTSTPNNECTRSHQLRMNERSHANSVPWMHAVWRLRKVTFFSFSLTRRCFGPIAYIHGTELVWLRSFMVRSWCELESDLTEYKNQHKVTLTSQSDFRSY